MPTFCLVFLILFILVVLVLGGMYLRKRSKKAKTPIPQTPVDVSDIGSSVSVSRGLNSKPSVQVADMATRLPSIGYGGSLSNHTHHNTSNNHTMTGIALGSVMSSNSHRDEDRCSGGYKPPTPSYSCESSGDSGSSSSSGGGCD